MVGLNPQRRRGCQALVLHPQAASPDGPRQDLPPRTMSKSVRFGWRVPLLQPVVDGVGILCKALHYQAYRWTEVGIVANVEMTACAQIEARGCDFAELFEGRAKGLCRATVRIAFGKPHVRGMLKRCLHQRTDDPVTLRCLRLFCDDILGPQVSATNAIKRAKKLLLQLHPDKTRHIPGMEPLEVEARAEAYSLVTHLRPVLEHNFYGPALYRPGRLDYGRLDWVKLRPTALAASLSAITVGFFLPSEPPSLRYGAPGTYWLQCSHLSP